MSARSPGSPWTVEGPAVSIVQLGAPVLRARAAEVSPEELRTPELQALFAKLLEVMRAAPGVGLAAPQLGVGKRVFVLEDRAALIGALTPAERVERERVPFAPRFFVNPVVRPVGHERAVFFEGCLSVRGYVGLVERSLEVEVSGIDERGTPQTWRVRGWPARILQHEADHLDGTLYLDRLASVPRTARSLCNAEVAKERFAGKPIAEILEALGR